MLTPVPPSACTRARQAASERLDGELSELEAAGLDAHLRACAECRAFADELAAIAARLRSAPFERPEAEIGLPARRRAGGLRVQSAAAALALVALATGSSFTLGRMLGAHASRTAPTATVGAVSAAADLLGLRADSTQQHMLAMLRRLEPGGSLRVGRVIAL